MFLLGNFKLVGVLGLNWLYCSHSWLVGMDYSCWLESMEMRSLLWPEWGMMRISGSAEIADIMVDSIVIL